MTINELLDKYNILSEKMNRLRNMFESGVSLIDSSEEQMLIESQEYPIYYNIGKKEKSLIDNVNSNYDEEIGKIFERPNSIEFVLNDNEIKNDGSAVLFDNVFKIDGFEFVGWHLRVGVFNKRYVLTEKGKFIDKEKYNSKRNGALKVFKVGDNIPVLPFDNLSNVVAEAVWKKI